MSKFSDWLGDAMHEHGGHRYRQVNLASDLGIQEATVSDWMKDKKTPGRDNIQKLAIHFGVTSRHIYELLGENPPNGLNDDDELLMGLIKNLPADVKHADQLKALLKHWGSMPNAKREEIMRLSERGGDAGPAADQPVAKPTRKRAN